MQEQPSEKPGEEPSPVSSRSTASDVPPTQTQAQTHLIERAGRRIAFHDSAGRLPVIVLDAGGGLDASHWQVLMPQLVRRSGCRIISYDRAGFGQSDEVSGPWSVHEAVADLAHGLQALGATQELLLVAHSLAGEIATGLALAHPTWVAGAVFVDANVPDFFTDATVDALAAAFEPLLAAARQGPQSRQTRQLVAVAESFVQRSRAFHQLAWPAALPATVIVSEHTPFDDAGAAQLWQQAQARFAGHAGNRSLVQAAGSSHNVALDRPDIVADAICEQLAALRGAGNAGAR